MELAGDGVVEAGSIAVPPAGNKPGATKRVNYMTAIAIHQPNRR
jgi:hypothetical protein